MFDRVQSSMKSFSGAELQGSLKPKKMSSAFKEKAIKVLMMSPDERKAYFDAQRKEKIAKLPKKDQAVAERLYKTISDADKTPLGLELSERNALLAEVEEFVKLHPEFKELKSSLMQVKCFAYNC
ncbi:MAG: hypothetical protein NC191_02955 [Muribaculaceae bacterium]|nr:hypothetical protein [Muribaculaceae bacterium]